MGERLRNGRLCDRQTRRSFPHATSLSDSEDYFEVAQFKPATRALFSAHAAHSFDKHGGQAPRVLTAALNKYVVPMARHEP